MANIQGLLTLQELAEAAATEEIDTVLVAFTDMYGRLVGKRFDTDFFLETVDDGTHGCNYLLTVDMDMEPIQGYKFANWETGYGDFHLVPDLSTLRRATWLDKTAMVFCDLKDDATERRVAEAPRSLLRHQVSRAVKAGFEALGASELEYYILEDTYREAFDKGYSGLQAAGWYIEDYHALQGARVEKLNAEARRHLKKSGVPVENSKGEWGLGQHELNIRYTDVLGMADRHIVYKQCLKELSDRLGMSVTFMAKYSDEGAGSSCHVHLSLRSGNTNAFVGDGQLGPIKCSDTFRWFLGGWISHVYDVMPFYAPTVNSYKRYQSGSWAPTALAWSHDNRTAGFRVVGSGQSLRIECRIPGADCNPYLVYAATLASGLDGIEKKIEPPPVFEGDVYASQDVAKVPATLRDATDRFEASTFAREAFGDQVVDHYTHFFRTEHQAYDNAVTDWDRKRYFERI